MKWTVNYPDTYDHGDVRLLPNKDGAYDNFRDAKKAMLDSIDTRIWELKQFKKEIRSTKKSYWVDSGNKPDDGVDRARLYSR